MGIDLYSAVFDEEGMCRLVDSYQSNPLEIFTYLTKGRVGYCRFNNIAWGKVLHLARKYGWDNQVEDLYCGKVSSAEALTLADCLDRALACIPENLAPINPQKGANEFLGMPLPEGVVCVSANDDLDPVSFCSDPKMKDRIKDFIDFCRLGGFEIK